jgi:hypothetical protein
MRISKTVAPSYEQLRPLKPRTSTTFPVYKDLVRTLVTAPLPSWEVAHVLATCSGYAYSSEDTVSMIMARMGLEGNRCLQVQESVDAMFICSTAFVIQSRCGRVVIVCYRGTEPANFINWLTDADVNPSKVSLDFGGRSGAFLLHGGFYRNVRATRYEVVNALERALERRSVLDDGEAVEQAPEAIYVTGHSLGAAMAAILGIMTHSEAAYERMRPLIKAIYTYGQPMVGSPELAAVVDQSTSLWSKFFRFVHGHDIIPTLPPRVSGPFAHFGREYRLPQERTPTLTVSGSSTAQLHHLHELVTAPLSFVAQQIPALRNLPTSYSLYDHGPQHYVAELTPPGVRTEFGD